MMRDKEGCSVISIHTLRVEGDRVLPVYTHTLLISIHTLRVEGDCTKIFLSMGPSYFNPHPPRGG